MDTLLLRSITEGRFRQTELLLKVGNNIDQRDKKGQTGLIKAMALEHPRIRLNIVKLLIRNDADASLVDVKKRNAFMWACHYGRADEIKYMFANCDINTLQLDGQDVDENTPLLLAVKGGHLRVVIELINQLKGFGMQSVIILKNKEGVAPLTEAFRNGNFEMAKQLIIEGNAPIEDLTNHLLHRDAFDIEWMTGNMITPQEMMSKIIQNLSKEHDPQPTNILKLLITNESFRNIALKTHGILKLEEKSDKKCTRNKAIVSLQEPPKTAPERQRDHGTEFKELHARKQKSIKCMLPTIMNMYEEQHCQNYRPSSKNDFVPFSAMNKRLRTVTLSSGRSNSTASRGSKNTLSDLPDFGRMSNRLSDGRFMRTKRSTSVQLPQLGSWTTLRNKLKNNLIHEL